MFNISRKQYITTQNPGRGRFCMQFRHPYFSVCMECLRFFRRYNFFWLIALCNKKNLMNMLSRGENHLRDIVVMFEMLSFLRQELIEQGFNLFSRIISAWMEQIFALQQNTNVQIIPVDSSFCTFAFSCTSHSSIEGETCLSLRKWRLGDALFN